jgi:hypothetical protein
LIPDRRNPRDPYLSESIVKQLALSFRGDAKHRTRNPWRRNNTVRDGFSGAQLRTIVRAHARPGMTKTIQIHLFISDTLSRSRGTICPSFAKHHARKQRAQETPGARPHPQPRVRNKKAHEQVTTGSAASSGVSCAMVLTVSFVLSPVIGLFCHRRQRNAQALRLT